MRNEGLLNWLLAEEEKTFAGWDFSYITETGRMASEPLTWSYASWIYPKLQQKQALLDMGTGGGEFLSFLRPLPPIACATEGYKPNIPIARKRLEPLGVNVFEVSDDNRLPFADETFDLIINRHESYSAHEVYRVLKYGGQFVTQQVGGQDCLQLNTLLGASAKSDYEHWSLRYAAEDLDRSGFRVIEKMEEFPYTRFYDIGALVYYLQAIPWQIPDFSVRKYFNELEKIHQLIDEKGYLEVRSHRFMIVAEKVE